MRASASRRLVLSLIIGVVAGVVVGALVAIPLGVLTLIATTQTVFVISGWRELWALELTPGDVGEEDLPPRLSNAVIVGAAVGGLAAIVLLLVVNGHQHRSLAAGIALAAVFMTWSAIHLVYAAHYAHLYFHHGEPGGIDFNDGTTERHYRDFLYFSYNLGMTYQVSDTSVSDSAVRSVVLRHCLLSYLFGVAILATTINLVSSIVL